MRAKPRNEAANDLVRTIISHRGHLLRIAARVLCSWDLAEDVVQDAALRACGMRCPLMASPLALCTCMVRNLAIDRLRRARLERRHLAPEDAADGVASPLDDPALALECRDIVATVMRALDELPSRTRFAFLQHRLHDVPQIQIAARLGVSATLVNFMIRDATAHCRARLSTEEPQAPRPRPASRPASRAAREAGAGWSVPAGQHRRPAA